MEAKRPGDSRTTVTMLMGVEHANTAGFVHGGEIMKLVDSAAGVAAMRHARGRVVTAQVDSLTFMAPVHMGDLLSLTAIVTQAWNSSMEVEVTVHRENPRTGEGEQTTRAFLTMVSVDIDGRPVLIPPLRAETDEERRRQEHAELRRQTRIEIRQAVEGGAGGNG